MISGSKVLAVVLALVAALWFSGCATTDEGDIPWGAGDANDTLIGMPGMQ